MKKSILVLLSIALMLSLAACGSAPSQAAQPTAQPVQETAPASTEPIAEPTTESATPAEGAPAEPAPTEPETTAEAPAESGSKILVLYFSRTGEQYNVGVIEKGNTAIVAEMIGEVTGADLYEILPADDHYPMTYKELTDVGLQEQRDGARPAFAGELPDLSAYDTIFIGSPVWWGDWPMIMYTIFESTTISGKTLIPFSTHGGSGLSGFDRSLASQYPDCTIGKGLAVAGTDAQNNQDKVRSSVESWLNGLGF